ncbi:hypothetical protein llap_15209 [Limosa lapponica baueri]|uniref:Uncharacterized protein n=1 Tax=Limosa lapponica baueri TaxID=1758121 RepID=A0A2I0TL17_LIMLA|nr:hypothetical protein llap_15209 [Limosa lapponica baueri]
MGAEEMDAITRDSDLICRFLSIQTPSSLDEDGAYDKTGAETACAWPVWVRLERKVAAESSLLNKSKNFVSQETSQVKSI